MTAISSYPSIRPVPSLLSYTELGAGRPMLLIHDITACGATFAPLLPTLAARYQVIVPDLRGHGQSARMPRAASLDVLVHDLEQLLDLLDLQHVILVGHAAGAAVAMRLARDFPQRVATLICLRQQHATQWSGSFGRMIRRVLPHQRGMQTHEIALHGPMAACDGEIARKIMQIAG